MMMMMQILLHNTDLKLLRGNRYGLLGGNDSGKTTLMRAIANGQVDGFPPIDEVRTVFVEADIQGELSDLTCIEYIFADPKIKACGVAQDEIKPMLQKVRECIASLSRHTQCWTSPSVHSAAGIATNRTTRCLVA